MPSPSLGEIIHEANYPVRLFNISSGSLKIEQADELLKQMHKAAAQENFPVSTFLGGVLFSVYPTDTPQSLEQLQLFVHQQYFRASSEKAQSFHINPQRADFLPEILDDKAPDLPLEEIFEWPTNDEPTPLSNAFGLIDNPAVAQNILVSYAQGKFVLPLNHNSSFEFREHCFESLFGWIDHCHT